LFPVFADAISGSYEAFSSGTNEMVSAMRLLEKLLQK
jgi:hypothetical protein